MGSKKWYNFSKLAPSPLPPKQCWIVSKMGDHKIFEGGGLKKGWTQNPSNNCFCFSTLSKILLIAIVVIWTLTHLSPANWGKRQSNCQGQIKEILRKEAKFYALPTSEDTTYKSKNSFRLKNLLSSIWPFPDHPDFADWTKENLKWYIIAGKFAQNGQERFYFRDMSQMTAMVSDHSGYKTQIRTVQQSHTGSIFAQILRKMP